MVSEDQSPDALARTLSFVRRPVITRQKISTLISNTCGTGLTAFLLRLRHRYWFAICTNGVASWDELEWMSDDGDTKTSMCALRMTSTICRERSLERIACDLRSRSLWAGRASAGLSIG